MKSKRRFLFGLLSSLLLTIGFARAAERFDPISAGNVINTRAVGDIAPICIGPCEQL